MSRMYRKKITRLISTILFLTVITLSIVIINPQATYAAIQATYFVSTVGNDSNPGTELQPFLTLEKARDTIRTFNGNMTGDIIVYIRGGTYNLTGTFQLDQRDSGTNGYSVIYKAYPGEKPVISGGQNVIDWTQHINGQWKAFVGTNVNFRQLYINGVRAVRARSQSGLSNVGYVLNDQGNRIGYTTTDIDMINWGNKTNIEFVYNEAWLQTRCLVSDITQDGSLAKVNMLLPYFTYAVNKHPNLGVDYPTYIENAHELLDTPGEWYFDRATGYLYYMPREGEDMNTVSAVIPILEKLVEVKGNLDNTIRNIQFEGITFSYGSYMATSEVGHNSIQANMLMNGACTDTQECVHMPSNVIVDAAQNIRFERCEFSHLGSNGLDIENGSDDNTVNGCKFYDISGNGIQVLGFVNDPHPTDLRKVCNNNSITNNYIHDVAVEYLGSVGIFVGYTDSTTIANNEVCDLPYTGITLGWGWGSVDGTPTPSHDNKVLRNHVHDVMKVLSDGGGIYTLGAQPGEIIEGNAVHCVSRGVGIYLDDGSKYITVISNVSYANGGVTEIKGSQHNIQYNYWDDGFHYWSFKDSTEDNNTPVSDFNQIPAILFNNAGIQPAYADIAPMPGFVDLALGKAVCASSEMSSLSSAWKAVDGSQDTGWSPTGTDTSPWLQIDLGSGCPIAAIELNSCHPDYGYAEVFRKNFEIRASNTSDFSSYSVLGGQAETAYPQNGSWTLKVNDMNNYRYIRIAKTANEYFYLADVRVWKDMGTNFALGASITADSQWSDHSPSRAVDGKWIDGAYDKWSSDCQTSSHWLTVDLGTERTINKFVVRHEGTLTYDLFGDIYNTNNFKIQGSSDGGSWNDLVTVTGNTQNETVHDISPITYRYFRLYITDAGIDNYTRIAEFEIRGPSVSSDNTALNCTSSASSNYSNDYNASKANDGSINTGWSPTGTDTKPWWQVDLGTGRLIGSIELTTRQDLDQLSTRRNFEVLASNTSDFSTYTVLGQCEGTAIPDKGTWTLDVTSIQKYRYIRVEKTANEYFYIAELKVFGY